VTSYHSSLLWLLSLAVFSTSKPNLNQCIPVVNRTDWQDGIPLVAIAGHRSRVTVDVWFDKGERHGYIVSNNSDWQDTVPAHR
jgi:hypothetical protein